MSIDTTLTRAGESLRRVGHDAAERTRRVLHPPPAVRPAPDAPPPDRHERRIFYWICGLLGGLVLAVALFLTFVDWNMLRGPIGRYVSHRIHREVVITGDLRVHPWSWTPSATAGGIRIGNPAWAGKQPMADIGGLTLQIRVLPLLRGHVDMMRVQIDHAQADLRRDLRGRATWDFSDGRKPLQPMRLPPIRQFIINDGRLRLVDEVRKLTFTGTLHATERLGSATRGFELTGDGKLNQAPFRLQVTGGPLLNIDRSRPYPFDALVNAGATRITARGSVVRPFDLGHLAMNATAQGADLADLYDLTGVAMPNTPPYRLAAHFTRNDAVYTFDRLSGRVGDSDLAGRLKADGSSGRMKLSAALRSRSLDFDDLGAMFGAAPKTGPGETVSATQVAVGRRMAAQQRLLPDATLKVDRLRVMDADVDYRAASIRDAPAPLRSGSVKVKLDHGVLTANPLAMELPQGRVAGSVRLDARNDTPVTDIDLRLSNARLEQLLPMRAGGAPVTGPVVGRFKLHGAGASVHRAAANASGQVTVVATGGEIRKAFAELMGVNVVKGLGLLWSKSEETTPIRCAVADFRAENGVLTARNIVFDTGPVLGTGSGTVNLDTERMDFRFQGHPKKFRIGHLTLPVTARGPIRSPKLRVEPSKAIAQGGLAALLGGVLSPLAAVLPFVDPGLAKDAACSALIAQAGQHGAPVSTVRR